MAVTAPPFEDQLRQHAAKTETGALVVTDGSRQRSARVFLLEGKLYAVHVDGFVPNVIRRFVTAGLLSPPARAQLLKHVDGDELDPSAGLMCVQLGMVPEPALDGVLREVLLSSLGAVADWDKLKAKFVLGATTTLFVVPPVGVDQALAAVHRRTGKWQAMSRLLAPVSAAPGNIRPVRTVADAGNVPPDLLALFAAADGRNTLDQMAGACGMTRFEAGHLVEMLRQVGVLGLPETATKVPATDVPATDVPATGIPATGVPAAGVPADPAPHVTANAGAALGRASFGPAAPGTRPRPVSGTPGPPAPASETAAPSTARRPGPAPDPIAARSVPAVTGPARPAQTVAPEPTRSPGVPEVEDAGRLPVRGPKQDSGGPVERPVRKRPKPLPKAALVVPDQPRPTATPAPERRAEAPVEFDPNRVYSKDDVGHPAVSLLGRPPVYDDGDYFRKPPPVGPDGEASALLAEMKENRARRKRDGHIPERAAQETARVAAAKAERDLVAAQKARRRAAEQEARLAAAAAEQERAASTAAVAAAASVAAAAERAALAAAQEQAAASRAAAAAEQERAATERAAQELDAARQEAEARAAATEDARRVAAEHAERERAEAQQVADERAAVALAELRAADERAAEQERIAVAAAEQRAEQTSRDTAVAAAERAAAEHAAAVAARERAVAEKAAAAEQAAASADKAAADKAAAVRTASGERASTALAKASSAVEAAQSALQQALAALNAALAEQVDTTEADSPAEQTADQDGPAGPADPDSHADPTVDPDQPGEPGGT